MSKIIKNERICLIVPAFPKLSESFIVNKFTGLLERGFDVHINCTISDPFEWNNFPDIRNSKNIRQRVHTSWPSKPHFLAGILLPMAFIICFLRNPKGTFRYVKKGFGNSRLDVFRQFYIDAKLIALRPDLIHFEFGALAASRMYLKERLGSKIISSFRGYDLNYVGLDDPGFYDEVWKKSDAFHFLGDDLFTRAKIRGCSSAKRYILIAPAVDTSFFLPKDNRRLESIGSPDRPLRIVSVGRLEWKKGYEYALKSVRQLIDEGICCQYRIIGGGKYIKSIAFVRHQLNLDEDVELLGPINLLEVRDQLEWADVFLHAAVSEGFCNAVLEAQAMQLPVVCSDADGLGENVEDGNTGFVVPRRNPRSLAEKLSLLASSAGLRQKMGIAGRKRVVEHFQLNQQLDRFQNFYHSVLLDNE